MIGITVFACIGLIALCSEAMTENEDIDTRVIYNVQVKPGSVTYGTHSTASVPPLAMPMQRSSAPLISGGAVRSYAHYGHSSMPARSASASGKGLYTTSSATLHSVGSGGGGGGGSVNGGSRRSTSHRISYGSGSVSVAMPALAMAASSSASTAVTDASTRGMKPRRIIDNGDGTYTGEYDTEPSIDGNQYWDEEEGWVNYTEGSTKIDGGKTYVYRNGQWELLSNQTDPENPTPLGDMPWIWMAVLAAGYCAVRIRKAKYTHCSACNAGASLESGEE